MFNLSAAMASKFVEAAEEMSSKIAELGPNPLKGGSIPSPDLSKESEL